MGSLRLFLQLNINFNFNTTRSAGEQGFLWDPHINLAQNHNCIWICSRSRSPAIRGFSLQDPGCSSCYLLHYAYRIRLTGSFRATERKLPKQSQECNTDRMMRSSQIVAQFGWIVRLYQSNVRRSATSSCNHNVEGGSSSFRVSELWKSIQPSVSFQGFDYASRITDASKLSSKSDTCNIGSKVMIPERLEDGQTQEQ